jgi:potassium efflux system protein
VTRRGLALKAALERRAAREGAGAEGAISVEQEAVNLAAMDSQTRRLVNGMLTLGALVGLWLLWSELLPALNIFERVTLWSYRTDVGGTMQTVPVTLADIGQMLLIIVVATAAVRNLPGLIEIVLLRHTEISAGGRYTVTTLTGYAITAVAALLVVGALGLNWGQVQWLVAALGVGIGFGLQEIVANFISGLIILFERPVRVGDVVTVGDTTGVVTKIEIRATTIRNWDRQELLVPNKEFITGRLLNWTLTDQINRISIPVGVDYGTDTRRAAAVLREVAASQPRVLEDPAPTVSVEGFGDNTVQLMLRCYLDAMEARVETMTELHQRILERFASDGIAIAFPQRDVHLSTQAPLEVVMRPAAGAAS